MLKKKNNIKKINLYFKNSYFFSIPFIMKNIFLYIIQDKKKIINSLKKYNYYYLMKNEFIIQLKIPMMNLNNFENKNILATVLLLKYISGGYPYICNFSIFKTFSYTKYGVNFLVVFQGNIALNFLEYYLTVFAYNIPKSACLKRFYLLPDKTVIIHTIKDFSFIRMTIIHSVFFN
jgi:hypothetical protein